MCETGSVEGLAVLLIIQIFNHRRGPHGSPFAHPCSGGCRTTNELLFELQHLFLYAFLTHGLSHHDVFKPGSITEKTIGSRIDGKLRDLSNVE
jgi:hypothetical protein